ncbi:MAG: hypothetical protein ACK48P_04915 [Holosporales bacterium]|jgi:hypothetical protein
MATLTIDTYASISLLRDSGFEEKQAKAVVDVLTTADLNHVANKQDLNDIQSALKQEIANLRVDVITIKADLLKWIIPLLLAQAGTLLALIKIL